MRRFHQRIKNKIRHIIYIKSPHYIVRDILNNIFRIDIDIHLFQIPPPRHANITRNERSDRLSKLALSVEIIHFNLILFTNRFMLSKTKLN